jgi:hypothetical protein
LSENDREPFLSRWSRRKLEAPGDGPAKASPPAGLPENTPHNVRPAGPAPLPALDSLDGLKSDYQAFMHSGVDEGMRRDALKKLFADPHFNKMDGLDVYIEDYSIESPIPEAMLRGLSQARSLFLFEEKDEALSPDPMPTDAGRVPVPQSGSETQAVALQGDAATEGTLAAEQSMNQKPALDQKED